MSRDAKIEQINNERKKLKQIIDELQTKKQKSPDSFSQIEAMQLKNNIGMHNELLEKIRSLQNLG